jgi:hypothetical protein
MMLKRTRWLVLVAEYIATGHDTNDSLRKPFQFGRGAMDILPYATHPVETPGILPGSMAIKQPPVRRPPGLELFDGNHVYSARRLMP